MLPVWLFYYFRWMLDIKEKKNTHLKGQDLFFFHFFRFIFHFYKCTQILLTLNQCRPQNKYNISVKYLSKSVHFCTCILLILNVIIINVEKETFINYPYNMQTNTKARPLTSVWYEWWGSPSSGLYVRRSEPGTCCSQRLGCPGLEPACPGRATCGHTQALRSWKSGDCCPCQVSRKRYKLFMS